MYSIPMHSNPNKRVLIMYYWLSHKISNPNDIIFFPIKVNYINEETLATDRA